MTDLKFFTLAEAVKTLPLVRRIVEDILIDADSIRVISSTLPSNIETNPQILRLTEKIQGYMQELEEIGCFFKDWNFQIGLVDFPSTINGEEVLLCWRSDEEKISFYHGFNEGYANRKLIPEKYFEAELKDSTI
jgi:hypothetical protein